MFFLDFLNFQEAYNRTGIAWALPRPVPCRGCRSYSNSCPIKDEGDTSTNQKAGVACHRHHLGCALVVGTV